MPRLRKCTVQGCQGTASCPGLGLGPSRRHSGKPPVLGHRGASLGRLAGQVAKKGWTDPASEAEALGAVGKERS